MPLKCSYVVFPETRCHWPLHFQAIVVHPQRLVLESRLFTDMIEFPGGEEGGRSHITYHSQRIIQVSQF